MKDSTTSRVMEGLAALHALHVRQKIHFTTSLAMVFADFKYSGCYEDIHDELFSFIQSRFDHVEGGLQGDSWIWVWLDGEKVAVDTFSSMTHQIKSPRSGKHVASVIEILKERYDLLIYPEPEAEPHED